MALKDNQPILKDLIKTIFKIASPLSVFTTEEKRYGREEKRKCSIHDTLLLGQEGMYEQWPCLKRIVTMEMERLCNGIKSKETIYYLCSEGCNDALYFAERIRAHWCIENNLHWHLDVTFKED